jgi:diguanylate cyclase (GGDEF)-like protein
VDSKASDKSELDRVAESAGVAVALVDSRSREVRTAGNNSICRELNPDGEFRAHCKAFCGTAFDEAAETGGKVAYTCHAGLECRAFPIYSGGRKLVAIVGRAFVKAENYRKATTRAISGDWKDYAPAELFENVLLVSSDAAIDKAADSVARLLASEDRPHRPSEERELTLVRDEPAAPIQPRQKPEPEQELHAEPEERPKPESLGKLAHPKTGLSNIAERFNREFGLRESSRPLAVVREPERPAIEPERSGAIARSEAVEHRGSARPEKDPAIEKRELIPEKQESAPEQQEPPREERAAEARAWRSFFSSLLALDYERSSESILEFVAHRYGLSDLIWLERNDKRLVNTAAYGGMKNRRLRLGIASDDPRLIEAAKREMPLEIRERPKPGAADQRTMCLFPIGLSGEISAGIAVFGQIGDEKTKRQISRICLALAPQLEILRLRSEVARGETLSTAVHRFSRSLKHIDSDDLWLQITQNAAEMLGAERASLMVHDAASGSLEIKALIGGLGAEAGDEVAGARVARLVFDKNKPIIVPDITKTGLPPAERRYKTKSFLSCPLSVGSRPIGVMSFADKVSGLPFDRSSLNLLMAIAPQIAVAIDRELLKEKAGKLEQLSVTDALTGLLNRRYLEARLSEEVKRSNRHGFPMSFMMIDVDHFKSYNDRFGHPAGDAALRLVGAVIRETLRGADVAARYGGEEFSVLLPQTTGDEAAVLAERIRQNIAEANFRHRRVTASIGIASCSADLCSPSDIVDAADKALYKAKERGRDCVVNFERVSA